jgi:hypothetical protein
MFLAVAAVMSCTSALADFSDVSKDAWYYDYVDKITQLNGFAGYEDGTFRPENQITQEEFLKVVVCLIDGEITEANKSSIKNPWGERWDDWALPYLDKAFELGLVTQDDYMFRYNGIPCARGEMAKIVTRAFEYLGEEPVADTSTYQAKIKDFANMDDKYKEYVLQAYAKGIISGYENGKFKADGYLTRAEASSVLVRLIDADERDIETPADEKLYDFYGRQVTWTEPLRTDIPEQYQICLADLEMNQATIDESLSIGGKISTKELNRSKSMMFEDLVLQSITYENDTIKLTIPDYLPENQRWSIQIAYWDVTEGYDFTTMKSIQLREPGEYSYSDIKVLETIRIAVAPVDGSTVTSVITISNGKQLTLERLEQPEVSFNNMQDDFVWIQGQGYKDYRNGYTGNGKIWFELEW